MRNHNVAITRSRLDIASMNAEQTIANVMFVKYGEILLHGFVDGVHVGLDISETFSGDGFWSRGTGRLTVKVGGYGDTNNFRQLKSGGHNYDKIALRLHEKRSYALARQEREKEEHNKTVDSVAVKKETLKRHGLYEYDSSLQVTRHGTLNFKASNINAEQAELLVKYALEIGAISK